MSELRQAGGESERGPIPSARHLWALRGDPVAAVLHGIDWTCVVLRGEIDLFNVDAIRGRIEHEHLTCQPLLVLDLRAVERFELTAIRVLLAAQKRLRWDTCVALAPRPALRELIRSSGLASALQVRESFDASLLVGQTAAPHALGGRAARAA
jgi:anti-anti-sigma factor